MDSLRKISRFGQRLAVLAATNGALDARPSVADAFADFQQQADIDFAAEEGRENLTDDLVRITVSRAMWLFRAGFDAGFYAAIEAVRQASRREPQEAAG
jgi:hypothetical protein